MSAFKKLKSDDISIIPHIANKKYDLEYTKLPEICGEGEVDDIKILTGVNDPSPFNLEFEAKTLNTYQKSVYALIKKMYYSETSSHRFINDIEFVNNFPILNNSYIRVIEIPKSKYGENIKRGEFILTSNSYKIIDDEFGNLYDILPYNKIHVGNIFYNQGVIVITNQEYKCMFPIEPTIFNKKYEYYKEDVKTFDLLAGAITYCDTTFDLNTLQIFDESEDFEYTLSGSIITFIGNSSGLSNAKFTIKDNLGICSNVADIEINVKEVCSFDIEIDSLVTENIPCYTNVPNYNFIKVNSKDDCKYSNDIEVVFIGFDKINGRENGIIDASYKFASNKTVNWSFSKDGGLSYFDIATSDSIQFNTKIDNPLVYLRNSFAFILRAKFGESYTEYHFKYNPISLETSFEKCKEYLDINLINDPKCLSNIYEIDSSGCEISAINWTFTGDMSGVILSKNRIALIGCRGTVIAEIDSRCCQTVTKILSFNGNCMETTCEDSSIELEVVSTKLLNNYLIFANSNFYLKEYPNWQFNGSVTYNSDINATYIEITVNNVDVNNTIIYQTKDFCKNFNESYTFSKITAPTTTTSSTTITTTEPIKVDIEYSDLELTLATNNLKVIKDEVVDVTLLVKNKGFAVATNVYIKLEYDVTKFQIDETSLENYVYQIINGAYFFRTNSILVGQYFSVKFKGVILGNSSDKINIKSQVYSLDQVDPDSIPNNGYIGEDDDSILTYAVGDVSNTTISTTFNCKPTIRDFPYTNYGCSGYNDNRGFIIINAINPSTNLSSGIEYSFSGDVDLNYQDSPKSELMSNGLYTVWVRLKANKSCKSSIKVRIACANGLSNTTWSSVGEVCIK